MIWTEAVLMSSQNSAAMKPTDFSRYISDFLSRYLTDERGASINTINAYRDTFVLLLNFMETQQQIKLEKLTLKDIDKNTVIAFLEWIQSKRGCSVATRNLRLAAIHSFYRYLQYQNLDVIYECQKILAIKSKKLPKETMVYLTVEGIKSLLKQPDTTTKRGRRDLALLSLMYDTGARVQEIIDLTPSMLHLGSPSSIKIIGKGDKARLVPMIEAQTVHLNNYIREYQMDRPEKMLHPLFTNSRKEKLTRSGITYILRKYVINARKTDPSVIPKNMSCHSLRHSKAMHLLQAGVNLVYIRDILGHVSIQTTEIYARADSKQKRLALEKAYVDVSPKEEPDWANNQNLIDWLKKF